MVAILILALLGVLYVLVVIPWRVPLTFRLFLGLIITWPVLSLYVGISLPAGLPDLHYHRGYVALLLGVVAFTAFFRPRRPSSSAFSTPSGHLGDAGELAHGLIGYGAGNGSAGSGRQKTAAIEAAHSVATEHPGRASFTALGQPVPQRVASTGNRVERLIPGVVVAYIILKLIALANGLALGDTESTELASYLDTAIIPVALYYLTKRLIISRERLVWLMSALVLTAFIVCLSGLYERVLDLTESAFPIAPHNEAGDTRFMDVPGGRATGVAKSPPVFGGILALGLLASLALLLNVRKWGTRVILIGAAVLFSYGIFVTFTRSIWLSVFVVLFCSQFYFRSMWKMTLPVFVLAAVVGLGAWGVMRKNDVVQSRVLNQSNIVGRFERFAWSWERFVEKPILGRGPGALDRIMQKHFKVDGFSTSHNTYMSMLVNEGVLVFACFWAVVFTWLAKAKAVLRISGVYEFERCCVIAMSGFLVIWLACGMSLELRYFTYYIGLFWIAGAVIEQIHSLLTTAQPAGRSGASPSS